MRSPTAARPTITALLTATLLAAPVAADEAVWSLLEASRERLAETPRTARFLQTFVPAGFSSGDQERGSLHLSLPGCLRWDYEEPSPRSYLLCDRTVWAWTPGEPVGDRFLSVSRDEAGLDFLLLSVERLRRRYNAALEHLDGGGRRIRFVPRGDEGALVEAEIVLDAASGLPVRLGYADRDGDRTSFDLEDYRRLDETDRLVPPEDIEWIDG